MKKCKCCGVKYSVMMKMQTEKYINGRLKQRKTRWLCPRCFLPIGMYLGHKESEAENDNQSNELQK